MPPGYTFLRTYQQAEIIFDLNQQFCDRFIDKRSRTHDQMVQAARSGKQNIAEGYMEKSLKSYIKLLGVAKASLVELLEDYLDFGRLKGVEIRDKWDKRVERDKYGLHILALDPVDPLNPFIPTNTLVNLIRPTTFLLERQIQALEKKFIQEGGFSENLLRKRLAYRRH